jgi:hypothetical protein
MATFAPILCKMRKVMARLLRIDNEWSYLCHIDDNHEGSHGL